MSQIATIEAAIFTACQSALAGKIYGVYPLSDLWRAQQEGQQRNYPAVFVAFAGGSSDGDPAPAMTAQFHVYAASRHAAGAAQARHSGKPVIGALEMLEVLLPRLHRLKVPGVGMLHFSRFEAVSDSQPDVAVYAAVFQLPLVFPLVDAAGQPVAGRAPDGSAIVTLDAFATVATTYDIAPADGNPEAQDIQNLPQ